MNLQISLVIVAGVLACLSLRWPQLLVAAVLICIVLLLSGCGAIQPFARADKDGYEAGVRGSWTDVQQAVVSLVKKAPASGRNGSFKEALQ